MPIFPLTENLPRAAAIDLDGTLFDSRTEVSARSLKAISACLDRHLPVIIATSRAERSVRRRFPLELLQRCSLVLFNGALARAAPPLTGQVDIPLPEGLAASVVECALAAEPLARVTLEILGFEFGMNYRPDAVELWAVNSATPDMLLTLEEALQRFPRKIAIGGLGRPLTRLADFLNTRFNGRISLLPSNDGTFLNILDARSSKSGALSVLLSSAGISLAQTLAFGDDLPDLDMLSACGYPVAMANAVPQVKAAGRYHTLSNDQDGVALVLEEILARITPPQP
jgi:hydroxymethylpyrimidine pyrophosphatase-like HAD family hydrolase